MNNLKFTPTVAIHPNPPLVSTLYTKFAHKACRASKRAKLLISLTLLPLALYTFGWLQSATVHAQSITTCATEVTVVEGDTLSGLANRYLGSFAAFPAIVEANNRAAAADLRFTRIDNPNAIAPGWRLCVEIAPPNVSPPAIAPQDADGPTTAPSTSPAANSLPETPNPSPANANSTPDLPFGRPVIEDEPHPLSIEFLRAQAYPGSEIHIKQTLTPGSNYHRYVVSYQSEGLEIDAYMTVPMGRQPAEGWPVVIFNHGYIPPELYRSTERYIAYTDAFARAGYLLLRPDYRGHGFSAGEAGGAYSRPDYTIDVLNAVAAIKNYPRADSTRIGMWGHSMGGYITLRAMVVDPDIKAGVIWAGVVASYPDLLEHWRRGSTSWQPGTSQSGISQSGISPRRGWRTVLVEEYGAPDENPEFWASISANSYLDELSGPLQLHHGSADTSVPLLFSQLLYEQIAAAEALGELYSYPGDDHNIAGNLSTALQRSVAFFDAHVK